jgi:hypothetical protein
MPEGKPAGVPCIHLSETFHCLIFNSPLRPKVCGGFMPETIVCGQNRDEALHILYTLEGNYTGDVLNS